MTYTLSLCAIQLSIQGFGDASFDLRTLTNSGDTCVLVEGPSGCGKTALLFELAAGRGKRPGEGLLYLHLGEQIDGKVRDVAEGDFLLPMRGVSEG